MTDQRMLRRLLPLFLLDQFQDHKLRLLKLCKLHKKKAGGDASTKQFVKMLLKCFTKKILFPYYCHGMLPRLMHRYRFYFQYLTKSKMFKKLIKKIHCGKTFNYFIYSAVWFQFFCWLWISQVRNHFLANYHSSNLTTSMLTLKVFVLELNFFRYKEWKVKIKMRVKARNKIAGIV